MALICLIFHLEAEIKSPPSMERREEVFHSLTWLTPLTSSPLFWHFFNECLSYILKRSMTWIDKHHCGLWYCCKQLRIRTEHCLWDAWALAYWGEKKRVRYRTYVMLHVHRARTVYRKLTTANWAGKREEGIVVSFMPLLDSFPHASHFYIWLTKHWLPLFWTIFSRLFL